MAYRRRTEGWHCPHRNLWPCQCSVATASKAQAVAHCLWLTQRRRGTAAGTAREQELQTVRHTAAGTVAPHIAGSAHRSHAVGVHHRNMHPQSLWKGPHGDDGPSLAGHRGRVVHGVRQVARSLPESKADGICNKVIGEMHDHRAVSRLGVADQDPRCARKQGATNRNDGLSLQQQAPRTISRACPRKHQCAWQCAVVTWKARAQRYRVRHNSRESTPSSVIAGPPRAKLGIWSRELFKSRDQFPTKPNAGEALPANSATARSSDTTLVTAIRAKGLWRNVYSALTAAHRKCSLAVLTVLNNCTSNTVHVYTPRGGTELRSWAHEPRR